MKIMKWNLKINKKQLLLKKKGQKEQTLDYMIIFHKGSNFPSESMYFDSAKLAKAQWMTFRPIPSPAILAFSFFSSLPAKLSEGYPHMTMEASSI